VEFCFTDRARGAQAGARAADIDPIVQVRAGAAFHSVSWVDRIAVDLFVATPEGIARAAGQPVGSNNRLVLNALRHGVSLLDLRGELESLRNYAGEMWARGPELPGAGELEALRVCFAKIRLDIERQAPKQDGSNCLDQGLDANLLAVHLERAFQGVCRVRGLWASSLREAVGWSEPPCKGVLACVRTFLECTDIQGKAIALSGLLDLAN